MEGHQKRSIGFLTEYAKKYDITLLSIQRVGESLEKNSPLLSLCEKVITVPVKTTKANLFTSVIKSLFNRLPVVVNRYVTKSLIDQFVNIQKEQHFDILHLDLLPLAQLANFTSIPTKILNQHNVESVLVEQRVELERFFLNKLILKYEFKNLHQFEVKHCSEFPLVLCCSENDKLLLNKFGATNVCVAPNGVYVDEFSKYSDYSDDRSAVFLGGMGWYPNKIGMQWFVDEVLPIVVSAVPDFQLNVVGNSQPAISIPDIYSNNINILGFVDDLQKIVCASNVMIVPITVGSGTRLKVVEGIAMGRAIVSTKRG